MIDIEQLAKNGTLFDERYKLLRPLSSDGGTADVWLALDTNTVDEVYDEERDDFTHDEKSGIQVAIKIYRPKNAMDIGEQRFRDEFKIVFNCHHSNLVQPINFSIFEGIPYLILPYCRKGSSESLQGKNMSSKLLWKYVADVSAGLAYLHAFNPTIVHHDIKPANILIDDNDNFAITDFGISSHRGLNREGYDDSLSGTMAYMAPERFKDDYESIPESDIWSFGATLYELITGKVPFGELGGKNQLAKNLAMPDLSQIPKEFKTLISDCLSLDPAKRHSAVEINRAAQSCRYPPRPIAKIAIAGGALIAVIVGAILLLSPKPESPKPPVPSSEVFAEALKIMSVNDVDSLSKGLAVMDSLGAINYVPALYELALTYGWYSDSVSVTRKNLLGIEIHTNGSLAYMPISYQINNKAIGIFTKIEELSDKNYPDINANALYRMACYYGMKNDLMKTDVDRAENILKQARMWAEQCNDRALLESIDNVLDAIKKNKQSK